MRQMLIDLIGSYTPVQVSDNLYLDVPFLMCAVIVCILLACVIKGVFSICRR